MKQIKYIFLVLICCVVQLATAQQYTSKDKKAIIAFEKARTHYDYGRDNLAVEELEKAVDIDDNFIEAHILIAQIYLGKKKYKEAIKEYEKSIEIDPKFWHATYYSLAKTQMKIYDYANAITNLEMFLTSKKLTPAIRAGAEWSLAQSKFAANAIKNPVPFEPKNCGASINTDKDEYWPTITADNQVFIFTRSVMPKITEDFFISEKGANGDWLPSKNVGRPINTPDNEGALSLSPDGQFVFFVACQREDSKGSCDLYIAKRSGNLWLKPMNLGSINSPKWDSSPTFSSDGHTLYFSSARGGGVGGMDIWRTRFDGSKWSRPENVKELNTRKDEIAPFIHPDDQTLYFASSGHLGMGGLDLFISRKAEDGTWKSPVNMGYPINTNKEEQGLFVNATGDLAYISSAREGGFGRLDIYSFPLYEEARPQKVTYAKGKVYDMFSKVPLGATCELIDVETEELIVSTGSDDKSGEFLVCLPINKDYALHVSKDGYLFYSETFSMTSQGSSTDPFVLDVPLQPITKEGGTVVLKNVFFNTSKYDLLPKSQAELNKLSDFLIKNSTMKIELGGHTDNQGSKETNQILSENRAKSVLDYLVSKGIEASRLTYKGYGDAMPIATNETPEGRQQNRRTEFKILAVE
ncbi:MAG: PD40 domain-containing protein [Flavobacteriales bacterium]|nr:PD40 domain-containing protein [Flavobacteriales bacterium]